MADHSDGDAGGDAGADGEAGPLSLDRAFGLLAEERRRYALLCLRAHRPTMTLGDLADEVATHEFDCRFAEIDPGEILEIYLSLYHTHIPKLANSGLLEYDQDRDMVIWQGGAGRLDRLLAWVETERDGQPDEEPFTA